MYALLVAPIAKPSATPADFVQEFRQRDQALLDAIVPGDVRVSDAVLAADAVYVDQSGEVTSRADSLKQ